MRSSKRQKIIDTMQMLDEEKEALTSNTYVHMTDCLLDLYKAVDEGLYVLKWIVFIPRIRRSDFINPSYVDFERSLRTSMIFLTPDQVQSIKEDINNVGSQRFYRTPNWEEIARTSVGPVPQPFCNLDLQAGGEEVTVLQPFFVVSIDEYKTGATADHRVGLSPALSFQQPYHMPPML